MKQYIYNHPNIKLNITSLGKSTTRFQSIIQFSNKIILPVTTSLVVYDLMTLKEIDRKQTNESVIYCVNQTEQYILSIGYGGDICKLDKRTFEIIQITNYNIGNQCRWSSINGNLMAVSAERSYKKGCVQIIDIEKMSQLRVFDGRYCYGSIIKRGNSVQYYVLKEYKHQKLSQEEKSKLNQKERQLRKNNQKYMYGLEIYGEGEVKIQEIMFPAPECEILLMAQSNDYLGYMYQDRRCCFIDLNKNNEMSIVKFEGAGSIMSCCFHNNNLVFSPKSKEICIYNIQEKSRNIQKIPKLYECPQGIIEMENITILATEGQILVVDNNGNLVVNQEFGGITKCGIDFFGEDQVVSGDFGGNLSIQKINCQEIDQIFIGIPIRCVTCNGNIIYVGTMDGSIYSIQNGDLQLFSSLEGSITCIRVKDNYILATTTHGIVGLFEGENKLSFLGHAPQNRSELFGSLDKYADIWSCIFDPCNDRFGTCSEDQSVKIFNYQGQEIITLKGHTLAVTCLDWKQGQLGLILYSCSDDRTIRMYDQQFGLIYQFNTYFVNEWHTLTYMCIIGDIIAIGAQNGYLYLYDIIKKQFTFANKIHMGGIEGLTAKQQNNIIGTCSSDDTINIIQL